MLRRIRTFLFSPGTVWSAGGLLFVGFMAGIVFWGAFNWTVEATNTERFCISCHVMRDNPYVEYQDTIHHTNASGVGAVCADCHVPRDWMPKMVRKATATRELYHWLIGTIDTPEKYEEHRAAMAQRVWDTMTANDSLECRNCHVEDRFDYSRMAAADARVMQEGLARGETCIDCHKGIAHRLPDMTTGYTRMQRDLVATALSQRGAGDPLFPITTISHYLDAVDAAADINAAGQVLAATRMEVLGRDGDAIRVRIEGWQQEGAERIIYARPGKRIFEATLTPDTTDRVEVHASQVDPDTDLVWSRVSLDTWVRPGEVIDDVDALWSYARTMKDAACGACHAPRDPTHHTANQWIGVLRGKTQTVALQPEEMRIIQKYMQLRARDLEATDGH